VLLVDYFVVEVVQELQLEDFVVVVVVEHPYYCY